MKNDLCGRLRSAIVACTNAFPSYKAAINELGRHFKHLLRQRVSLVQHLRVSVLTVCYTHNRDMAAFKVLSEPERTVFTAITCWLGSRITAMLCELENKTSPTVSVSAVKAHILIAELWLVSAYTVTCNTCCCKLPIQSSKKLFGHMNTMSQVFYFSLISVCMWKCRDLNLHVYTSFLKQFK